MITDLRPDAGVELVPLSVAESVAPWWNSHGRGSAGQGIVAVDPEHNDDRMRGEVDLGALEMTHDSCGRAVTGRHVNRDQP